MLHVSCCTFVLLLFEEESTFESPAVPLRGELLNWLRIRATLDLRWIGGAILSQSQNDNGFS